MLFPDIWCIPSLEQRPAALIDPSRSKPIAHSRTPSPGENAKPVTAKARG